MPSRPLTTPTPLVTPEAYEQMRRELARVDAENARLRAQAEHGRRERDALRDELDDTNRDRQWLRDSHRAIRIRITDIADESFGPFPVQSADESLTAIERGIFEQRMRIERMRPVVEAAKVWRQTPGCDDTNSTAPWVRALTRMELAIDALLASEAKTGQCATCGDRIARDGTCQHVRGLLAGTKESR